MRESDGVGCVKLHRRMFHDDSFGVGEALNETGVSGKGLIVRGNTNSKVNIVPVYSPFFNKILFLWKVIHFIIYVFWQNFSPHYKF